MQTLEDLCADLGLRILRKLPGRTGASLGVAHVLTASGEPFVLKQTAAAAGADEIAVLRAASGSGTTADFVRAVGTGAYVMEWLPGGSLAETPLSDGIDAGALGETIRAFHAVQPPPALRRVARGFFSLRAAGWRALEAELCRKGLELSANLDARDDRHPVLLHGDLVPTNVVMTPVGPRLIDPAPLVGPAAWDIAQLAVTAFGRGRSGLLRPLLRGYGRTPDRLDGIAAWMALHYLDKNLAAPDSPFTQPLRRLVSRMVAAPDTQTFLQDDVW